MRLERMEIAGFKSFSDRTEVRFQEGITAVVGPNGCGKSNIGDAINWVLGEQSAKMLRGKQMADVIFAGSAARKPMGMAEVSLHLGDSEGVPHGETGKVVVTRRLFRSGESDYLLNGQRTRLKDIQELLNEARVGARSYATIEQGRIDQILNAKPKERRQIIEDAAGIAGYKNKRRLTELKLEATHANLLRVNDIVQEVERQIRSLKRQAAKARRYRKLREELRDLDRIRFGHRARQSDAELNRLREQETAARDLEAESAARLGREETGLEAARRSLEQDNGRFRELADELHRLELEIDREEGQIRSCGERIEEHQATATRLDGEVATLARRLEDTSARLREQQEVAGRDRGALEEASGRLADRQTAHDEADCRLKELREQIETGRNRHFEVMNRAADLRNQRRSSEEALERSAAQRARLEAESATTSEDHDRLHGEVSALSEESASHEGRLAELDRECEALSAELATTRERHAADIEALAAVREREKSASARLATLEDVATRFAGVSDGVRTLLTAKGPDRVPTLGVVADFIEAGPDVESAAESYLAAFLPTVIVKDDDHLRQAADLLQQSGAGRTCLISSSQPSGAPAVGQPSNGHGGLPPELATDARVRGRLSDRLELRATANGVIRDRMGDAVLVDSLESALELHRRYPKADYLTPEGDVVYASGVVAAGGRGHGDHGLLAHNRRVDEARTEVTESSTGTARLHIEVDQLRERIVELEVSLQDQRQTREEVSRRRLEIRLHLERSTEDRQKTSRRAEILLEELEALRDEDTRLKSTLVDCIAEVEKAEDEHRTLEHELRARQDEAVQQEVKVKEIAEQVAEMRAEVAVKQERSDADELESGRLQEAVGELESRIRTLREEGEASRKKIDENHDLRGRTEHALAEHLETRKKLATESAAMEVSITERRLALEGQERGLKSIRDALEAQRETTREAELARTRAESDRAHLDELAEQELGMPANEAASSLTDEEASVELEQVESEAAKIRDTLERMGPVNMTAIEEFTELEERHGFLTSQRSDLDESMTSLRETIRRINRTSRDRFTQAFEAISTSYREIFKVLFNGGNGDLQLEEGEDVLECGIEIMAQPPGKRHGSIQLLSGGEKALSAIALLFAVFRFQPSPFCLLDEVDAALDDSNVGRFTRMLREYALQTQFIVVTHNKLSMESADLLYGVTMEEPGVSKVVSLRMQ